MPQSGSDRKRKWKMNKRMEGWTNSMIQNGNRSSGLGHSHGLSHGAGASGNGSGGGLTSGRRSNRGRTKGGHHKVRRLLFGDSATRAALASHEEALVEVFGQAMQDWGIQDEDVDILPELDGFIDRKHSRVYSNVAREYGKRGGEPYVKPRQWRRFSVRVPDFDERFKTWAVAYHGTKRDAIRPILMTGIRSPNDRAASPAHGQAFAGEHKGDVMYVSPCLGYASHPVYSQLFDIGEGHFAQIVFQCRVDTQRIWARKPSSLGESYWPKDVRFAPEYPTHDNMEWLFLDASAIQVYAILMREFGPKADASIYGELVTQVKGHDSEPEFEWTKKLAASFREYGHVVQI